MVKSECQCFLRTQAIDWSDQTQRLTRRMATISRSQAEDLAQEAMCRALSQCCRFDPLASRQRLLADQVGAWIGGFVPKILLEHLREQKKRQAIAQFSSSLLDQKELSFIKPVDIDSISTSFQNTLKNLSPADRETVLLHHHGRSTKEIASEQGITEHAVYQRLSRYRQSFRSKMDREFVTSTFVKTISSRIGALELNSQLLNQLHDLDCQSPGEQGLASFDRLLRLSTTLTDLMKQEFIAARLIIDRLGKSDADKEYAYSQLVEWVLFLEQGDLEQLRSTIYRKRLINVVAELGAVWHTNSM